MSEEDFHLSQIVEHTLNYLDRYFSKGETMSSPATPKPSSPAPKQAWYVKLANGVEHLAVEALGFVRKAEAIEPAVQGAFGTMLGAFDKALSDVDSAAQNPTVTLSMTFDSQVFADLKSAWSAVLAFAATLGIYKK